MNPHTISHLLADWRVWAVSLGLLVLLIAGEGKTKDRPITRW